MIRSSVKDVIRGCDLTVLACIDYRQHGSGGLDDYLQEHFHRNVRYDLVTRAGCVFRFLYGPPEARVEIFYDLDKSIGHEPERLVIAQHTDCAVYNANRSFSTVTDEIKALVEDARTAARIIALRYPALTIDVAVLKVEGGRILGSIYHRTFAERGRSAARSSEASSAE